MNRDRGLRMDLDGLARGAEGRLHRTGGPGRLRLAVMTGSAALLAIALGAAIPGCITHPQNPAATQPATVIDLATTQPSYWMDQPPAAQVDARDFDTLWEVCKGIARDYLFVLDRVDYRAGEITTVPMVSKQIFEPWRRDSGTAYQSLANSMGAIRRTLSFSVARNNDQTYTITPRVLVEREVILERHVTDVSQYRLAFSGPGTKIQPREAVTLDPQTYPDIPIKYWYPTGRDEEMEVQVAARVRKALERRHSIAGKGSGRQETVASSSPRLQADGVVSDLPADGAIAINLGAADKVVAGMTFEVYDGRATLPTLESYASVNPQSKGWIEVVSVGNGQSVCRILQKVGAVGIRKGDQIFNFVYQRGGSNHFALLGDFGGADRATLANLIQRWGGAIDHTPSPDTRYAILGARPKDAAAAATYDAARSQVEQLRIPTVTEERFDLLIRYYDPSKR